MPIFSSLPVKSLPRLTHDTVTTVPNLRHLSTRSIFLQDPTPTPSTVFFTTLTLV